MTELRILNVIVWGIVALFMLFGGALSALGRNPRRGEPMRLACLLTANVMVGFSLRWLLIPEDTAVWQALYVLAAADALYIMWVALAYGRGDHVG